MNGKCKECQHITLRSCRIDQYGGIYNFPVCSALKEQYDECMKIKSEYREFPSHVHNYKNR